MVVAPHSSFLDMVIMFPAQLPCVVSRSENKNLPVIGGKEMPFGCHANSLIVSTCKAPFGFLKNPNTDENSWFFCFASE